MLKMASDSNFPVWFAKASTGFFAGQKNCLEHLTI
jgi:hypothetical protein